MEDKTAEMEQAWGRASNAELSKAATKDRTEYSHDTQLIIEVEAKRRGIWDWILYLRGDKQNIPDADQSILPMFVCEVCKGNNLNLETGRCGNCFLSPGYFSYCQKCDEFPRAALGYNCPKCGTNLVREKAATQLLRFANDILDRAIFIISLLFIGILLRLPPIIAGWVTLFLLFIYYFAFEAIWQRTPAKFITGTKVINADGSKPSIAKIVKRSLIRFIPFEDFSFLGDKVYGWHDRWSQTFVIRAKRFPAK
jgi:hypothetical protein